MSIARLAVSAPVALMLAAHLAVPLAALGADGAGADSAVPIRTITLYRSGVGAFERTGRVTGDAVVPIRFQTDQINDILKSLVVLDLDGGTVGPVSYASNEPLARRLDAFRINIADNPSVSQLLDRLRGEQVRLVLSDGPVEGTILGVENRFTTVTGSEPGFLEEPYVSMITATGIRSIAVSQVRSFELVDPELAAELSRALATLAEHRADRATTVDLRFDGPANAERDVLVAYVHEMPVWKTTYRLVLPTEGATKPTIQGWAIVENTTDQDWRDVRLSLASGKPVAFRMDLYEPLFAFRPIVPVPFAAGLMPRVYEGGIGPDFSAKGLSDGEIGSAAEGFDSTISRRMSMPQAAAAPPADFGDRANEAAFGAEMQSGASGTEIGEQFFFTVDMPVSVDRQRSAMLPILSEQITGRRVSIFTVGQSGANPMRGVQLTNDSGVSLMPGPVAVYDGSAYAGDAQIPHSARNDSQLLAYAADLDVTVVTDSKTDETINSIRIVSGSVIKEVTRRLSTVLRLANADSARDRTVIVEHPRQGMDWETVEPKPFETTDTVHRFEVAVPRAGEATATIVQRRVERSALAVTSFDDATLVRYTTNGKMSKAVADAIRKGAEMQAAVNGAEQQIARIGEEIAEIGTDQDRIRRNIGSIDRNSELYARYMKTLNDQENRLDQLRVAQEEGADTRAARQRELEEYIRGLNVE